MEKYYGDLSGADAPLRSDPTVTMLRRSASPPFSLL